MFPIQLKILLVAILFFVKFSVPAYSQIVKQIDISGNERISDETILMFSKINIDDNLSSNEINDLLKRLYDTNFFSDISIDLNLNKLSISVEENAIIENISYNGIKSKTLKKQIIENLELKPRSSFDQSIFLKDKNVMTLTLKNLGYYFSTINTDVIEKDNNMIDLIYNIKLGQKAKIKKIAFIGDKKYKDNKLRSLIVSEEYKFWKLISGKKYLNEAMINFDKRLLKNFYLNKGYYDVEINSSFAKLLKKNEFELIYSINAKNKFFFDNLNINLPSDFEPTNYENLKIFLQSYKDKPYSINAVENILNKIDLISINDQYQSVKATVSENIVDDKISLVFNIEEVEKFLLERINIFGNNITRESVIRNRLVIDEGDPFNEILANKSINEIKSLNFFKTVNSEIINGKNDKSKIINITVEEKPTGELSAGAGFGTSGEVIEFGVRENNYLGKGLGVDASLSLSSDKTNGMININNPNYNNSDKSVNFRLQAVETDKLSTFGYKSNKIGSSLGTKFEYLEDFKLGLETSAFLEKIDTDSNASARQKTQEGNYFDAYLNFNFDYDKRNQKFKTTDGFRSIYSLGLPVVSDNYTLNNFYTYKTYSELYENNVSSLSISLKAANSITGDDVKLSERLFVPQNKLRGFVNGKIGPKDGSDFIGGNYYALMNLSTNLPQILPNAQNIDVISFVDIANLWGVDDTSLDKGSQIRTSVGIGIDLYTVVGPLSFSLATPITKSSTDKTETFRFNLGTSF